MRGPGAPIPGGPGVPRAEIPHSRDRGEPMIHLEVLGRADLSVSAGDEAPEPSTPQPKRFALLAYLALARPRGFQRRDSLLALFWPESTEDRARNALNQSLHALRTSLGGDVLISRGREAVGVARDRLRSDAVAFDEAFEADRYEDALDLYRGELLEGFHVAGAPGFQHWLDRERTRFRRQAQAAAGTLADRKRRQGNLVGAARWLERALEIAPVDETVLRRLVSSLDEAGDRAGALRAYDRFEEDVESRLGTRPSPETRELVARIREREEAHGGNRGPVTAEPGGDEPSVGSLAVLPLDNLRDEPDRAYFVEGLTEALTGELARIEGLRVISRQSVLRFRDSERPLFDIGETLGVDAVVEGSVLRVGDRVRLTLQLVKVDPEEHLWAGAFERDLTDVLALQRDVARAVAARVEGVLAPEDGGTQDGRPDVGRKVHPEAYDAFLEGIARMTRQRPEDLMPAIERFREAAEFDPGFAEPTAWIAVCHANALTSGLASPDEARDPMREAARRAMELDAELSPAHLARALTLQLFDRDWSGALEAYGRAIRAPGGTVHTPWHGWLTMFLIGQGRFEEGLSRAREELEGDPIGPTGFVLGWALHKARRFDASLERLQWTLELWPDYPVTLPFLAASRLFVGQADEAAGAARRAVEAAPRYQTALAYAAATLARAGEHREAEELAERLDGMRGGTYVDPFNLAVAQAGLGERDAALDELERLAEEGSPQTWAVPPEPFFDPLRKEARFDAVLERLDLPRLEFQAGG